MDFPYQSFSSFFNEQQIDEGEQTEAEKARDKQKEYDSDRSRSLTFFETAVEPDEPALWKRKDARAQKKFKKFRIFEILQRRRFSVSQCGEKQDRAGDNKDQQGNFGDGIDSGEEIVIEDSPVGPEFFLSGGLPHGKTINPVEDVNDNHDYGNSKFNHRFSTSAAACCRSRILLSVFEKFSDAIGHERDAVSVHIGKFLNQFAGFFGKKLFAV